MSSTKQMLNNEDLRWLELIQDIVNGLRAQADIEADGCAQEWMAMYYSLESLNDIIKSCVDNYKERLGVKDAD